MKKSNRKGYSPYLRERETEIQEERLFMTIVWILAFIFIVDVFVNNLL